MICTCSWNFKIRLFCYCMFQLSYSKLLYKNWMSHRVGWTYIPVKMLGVGVLIMCTECTLCCVFFLVLLEPMYSRLLSLATIRTVVTHTFGRSSCSAQSMCQLVVMVMINHCFCCFLNRLQQTSKPQNSQPNFSTIEFRSIAKHCTPIV